MKEAGCHALSSRESKYLLWYLCMVVVRETKTFAWGSNRKGQCGIEGGKCATVPEPLPVVLVKRRGEMSKSGSGASGSTTTTIVLTQSIRMYTLKNYHWGTVAYRGIDCVWRGVHVGEHEHGTMWS